MKYHKESSLVELDVYFTDQEKPSRACINLQNILYLYEGHSDKHGPVIMFGVGGARFLTKESYEDFALVMNDVTIRSNQMTKAVTESQKKAAIYLKKQMGD